MIDSEEVARLKTLTPSFFPPKCEEADCEYSPQGFVRDQEEQKDGSVKTVTRYYCAIHMRSPQRYGPDGEPIGRVEHYMRTPMQKVSLLISNDA